MHKLVFRLIHATLSGFGVNSYSLFFFGENLPKKTPFRKKLLYLGWASTVDKLSLFMIKEGLFKRSQTLFSL